MKVKDVIKHLQELDPDKEVRIRRDTFSTMDVDIITLSGDMVIIDNYKSRDRYQNVSMEAEPGNKIIAQIDKNKNAPRKAFEPRNPTRRQDPCQEEYLPTPEE